MKASYGRRAAAALLSFGLAVAIGLAPVGATFVVPVEGPDGLGPSGTQSHNVQGISGNAVSGSATPTSDPNYSDVGMVYRDPNDGTTYNGTQSIVSTAADGTLIGNSTATFTDRANGGTVYAGQDHFPLPPGGSVSISVTATNGNGASFTATWTLRNYRP